MRLILFGANGPTGRELTRQALDAGHDVRAVTRHPAAFPIQHKRLETVAGDVYNPGDVERAVAGGDAVLSSLGVAYSRAPIDVYSVGAAHIIAAMQRASVRHLICVSSGLTDAQSLENANLFTRLLIGPLLRNFLGKTLYDDMARMEALVRASPLDWTIIRPAGLFDSSRITAYRVAENTVEGSMTSRPDLAACMLAQASNPASIRTIQAVVTVQERPNFLAMIRKEAFKRA